MTARCRRWFVPGSTVRLYLRGADSFEVDRPRGAVAEGVADADGSIELSHVAQPGTTPAGYWVEGDQGSGRGVRAVAFTNSGSQGQDEHTGIPVGPP